MSSTSSSNLDSSNKPASGEEPPGYTVVERRFFSEGEPGEAPGSRDDPAQAGPDDPTEGRAKPAYVEQLEQQLEAKAQELTDLRARHGRAVQEFDEARTRLRREVPQEIERGKRAFLADLLEVVDTLDRALEAAQNENGPLVRGVEAARDQFLSKLKAHGVERRQALGEVFDPNQHEAVTTLPAKDPAHVGRVVGVIRPCYAIGDTVLRPAMVAVGRPVE